ncbi:hypothetical protein [Actinomadura atramentaria]|uniref:hypothetical protein n=1 Tax=Actinomadura atramentaria TaxID=1990 RepID=UPI0003623E80|nr:hypothetical protein [Actinomadura atramentaria]
MYDPNTTDPTVRQLQDMQQQAEMWRYIDTQRQMQAEHQRREEQRRMENIAMYADPDPVGTWAAGLVGRMIRGLISRLSGRQARDDAARHERDAWQSECTRVFYEIEALRGRRDLTDDERAHFTELIAYARRLGVAGI